MVLLCEFKSRTCVCLEFGVRADMAVSNILLNIAEYSVENSNKNEPIKVAFSIVLASTSRV